MRFLHQFIYNLAYYLQNYCMIIYHLIGNQNIYDLIFYSTRKKDVKYIHIFDFLFNYRVHSNSLSKKQETTDIC